MRFAIEIIKRYSLREVALLGVFALGLLIAWLIVAGRSRIAMSDAIALRHSGLSVSIPVGRGWESRGGWIYNPDNKFSLSAQLMVGLDMAASVQYRYLIAPEKSDVRELMEKDIAAAGMVIGLSGQISNDIVIDWAELCQADQIGHIYLGIGRLDSNRILVINVNAPGDSRYAGKLFRSVIKSIQFESDALSSRGSVFAGKFKDDGLNGLAHKHGDFDRERAWLIEDKFGEAKGFQIESFEEYSDGLDWAKVKAQRVHYLMGAKGDFTKSTFDCSENLDRFIWRTGQRSMRASGTGAFEVELGVEGSMRVSGITSDLTYWPSEGAVAEILLDTITRVFLSSYSQDVLIDFIFPNGMIVPTLISSVDVSQDANNSWGASYGVQVDFFHSRKNTLLLYFDYNREMVGKVEKKRDLIWHKSDRNRLTEVFGNLERYSGRRSIIRQNQGEINE